MNSSTSGKGSLQSSVIIPTYRGADKLPVILASLTRQTMHRDVFEVIVVDDGSDEEAALEIAKVCRSFENSINILLTRCEKNGGPARARNRGIAAARGDYIFFTDDDCEVPALWIETHLRWYERMSHITYIGGWYFFTRQELNRVAIAQFWYIHYRASFPGIDLESFIGTSDHTYLLLIQNTANLSIRRSVLRAVSGFDERYLVPGREDTSFAMQLKSAGFTGLFIPLHVRHTSKLTLKRFLRVTLNRGLAHYVFLRNSHWMRYSSARYVTEWRTYTTFVDWYTLRHRGVQARWRTLKIIGFIYYWGVGSSLALAIHAHRWRRKRAKRDEN